MLDHGVAFRKSEFVVVGPWFLLFVLIVLETYLLRSNVSRHRQHIVTRPCH